VIQQVCVASERGQETDAFTTLKANPLRYLDARTI
jgi:hypothetical protein